MTTARRAAKLVALLQQPPIEGEQEAEIADEIERELVGTPLESFLQAQRPPSALVDR